MRYLKNIVHIALVIFVISESCLKTYQKEFLLPEYIDAELDSITIKPTLLFPIRMIANDSFLITIDLSTDTIFRVFSIPHLTYLGWFGKKGRGPHEFINIDPSGIRFRKDGLQIVDLRNIYLLTFTSTTFYDNFTIKEKISIPGELLTFNHVIKTDEKKVCGVCLFRDSPKSLDCFNMSTKEIVSFLDYPKFIKNLPENERRAAYNFSLDLKPDMRYIALVYSFSPIIRICNNKGEILFETLIKGLPEQIIFQHLGTKATNLLNGTTYYNDIKTTDRFIYLFYNPQEGKRINEHKYENFSKGQKELHILNWQGTPVGRVKLDKSTLSIVPSRDDRYVYFTTDKSPNKIYYFDLKSNL